MIDVNKKNYIDLIKPSISLNTSLFGGSVNSFHDVLVLGEHRVDIGVMHLQSVLSLFFRIV